MVPSPTSPRSHLFVRRGSRLVVPNAGFFIGILIVFEAVTGVLILSGGRRTQLGLLALIAFHIGQLAFGGVMWVWAPLMLITLLLLLRAERQAYAAERGDTQVQQSLPGQLSS